MCAIPANMLWDFLLCWDKLQTISQTCLQLPLHFILLPLLFPPRALEIQIPKEHLHNDIFLSNLSFAFFHSMLVAGSSYMEIQTQVQMRIHIKYNNFSSLSLRPLFYFTLLPLGFPRRAHQWKTNAKKIHTQIANNSPNFSDALKTQILL